MFCYSSILSKNSCGCWELSKFTQGELGFFIFWGHCGGRAPVNLGVVRMECSTASSLPLEASPLLVLTKALSCHCSSLPSNLQDWQVLWPCTVSLLWELGKRRSGFGNWHDSKGLCSFFSWNSNLSKSLLLWPLFALDYSVLLFIYIITMPTIS